MRVSVVQMGTSFGRRADNVARALALVDRAMAEAPDLVVLPELFSVGALGRTSRPALQLAESPDGPTLAAFRAKARQHRVAIAVPVYERTAAHTGADTVVLLDAEGEWVGAYRKTHLAGKPLFDEVHFQPGHTLPLLRHLGWHIGLLFGSELMHPEAGRVLSVLGAELLLVPAAGDSGPLWRQLHSTRAFENGCYLVVASLSGPDDSGGPPFAGQSLCVDPLGTIVGELPAEGDGILSFTVEFEEIHRARNQRFMLRDRRPDLYAAIATP
jgi:N-carbamoylputrescine amidase